ncbi:MAG TPA: hypothetical protein DCL65_07785 [Chryseobacterium sp.]|nr:hypothetical protein [Chryseobacterium sp.]
MLTLSGFQLPRMTYMMIENHYIFPTLRCLSIVFYLITKYKVTESDGSVNLFFTLSAIPKNHDFNYCSTEIHQKTPLPEAAVSLLR